MPQKSSLESEDSSSSSGLDERLFTDIPKRSTNRTRKIPTRFGVDKKNDGDLSTDEEEDFTNSEEEIEYVPPIKKTKRELINAHEASVPSSQKGSATTSSGSTMHALDDNDTAFFEQTSVSLSSWNFNGQFDLLTKEIAIGSTACKDNAKSVHEVTSNIENNVEVIHGSAQNCVTLENNASSEQTIVLDLDDTSGQNSACKCNFKILGEKLDIVNRKLTEMLARQSVLEKAILKKGEFNGPVVEGGKLILTDDRKIKTFMETHFLPMTNIECFKSFEIKLEEEEFSSSAKAILLLAVETKFDIKSMSSLKILKAFLYQIIDRRFLSDFTWTGKSKKAGLRKIALKEFNKTVKLVYELTAHGRPDYTESIFHKDMVDRVLKFAYELPLSYKTIAQPDTVHVPSNPLHQENILPKASTGQTAAHSIGKILDFPWNK